MHTYIGIDLHKVKMTWVGIKETENSKIFNREYFVTPEDLRKALGDLEKLQTKRNLTLKEVTLVIEPCCGWMWVYELLKSKGLDIHITNPRKVRAIADSLQKTDENDALTLALLLRTGILQESRLVSPAIKKLRSQARERNFFVRERSTIKCRLESIVTREGRHLIEGSLNTKKGNSLIVASDYSEWKRHRETIEFLDKQITILDKELETKVTDLPICKLLQSVPGIGIVSAVTIYAEIADFNQFSKPEKLAAFAGLVPTERSSGGVQKLGHITHAGSKYLRYALVEVAMHIRDNKKSKKLYDFYKKIKDKSGAMKARVALARKILTILWYMVKRNEVFNPQYV